MGNLCSKFEVYLTILVSILELKCTDISLQCLILLVGRQKGHLAYEKLGVGLLALMVT